MQSYELVGDWSIAGTAPAGADLALRAASTERGIDLYPGTPTYGAMPMVFVATVPTTLIVTDGDPQFVPFAGTPLLKVSNTAATVFKEPTDQQLYVHDSNGWFRAWTTSGPWQRIREQDLPRDVPRT
jgi:hypothetical protein